MTRSSPHSRMAAMVPSENAAAPIDLGKRRIHGWFGYIYLVLPTITMLVAGTFAIVDLSPLPTRFPYWFMPFWVGLLSVPGYVFVWNAVRRRRWLSLWHWRWGFGSVATSALCGFAGAVFSAFTIVLGLLSFMCALLSLSLLRLVWKERSASPGRK